MSGDAELGDLINEELPDSRSAYYSEINSTGNIWGVGWVLAFIDQLEGIGIQWEWLELAFTTGLTPEAYRRYN